MIQDADGLTMFKTPQLLWARLLTHSFLDDFCNAQLPHAVVFYASAVYLATAFGLLGAGTLTLITCCLCAYMHVATCRLVKEQRVLCSVA